MVRLPRKLKKQAILVVNTWTKSEYLMPRLYSKEEAEKEKARLDSVCSTTGNIKNNSYKIIQL